MKVSVTSSSVSSSRKRTQIFRHKRKLLLSKVPRTRINYKRSKTRSYSPFRTQKIFLPMQQVLKHFKMPTRSTMKSRSNRPKLKRQRSRLMRQDKVTDQ